MSESPHSHQRCCQICGRVQVQAEGALGAHPSSAVASPQLFSRLAVPNLCAA